MHRPGTNPYQSQAVETASPAQLVLMLYDRMLIGILRARQASDDRSTVNAELQRIQLILTELMVTLDHDRGGDIAGNLLALYEYCRDRVINANLRQDLALIDDVEGVIRELRDAWEEGCVHSPQPVGTS